MNAVLDLLNRYNEPTPRYTSYPPAPHWQNAHGGLLTSALRRSTAPLSVYVHIPFYDRLCLYCGCNVVIKKDHVGAGPYVEHITAEVTRDPRYTFRPDLCAGGGKGVRCISGGCRCIKGSVVAGFQPALPEDRRPNAG